MIKNIFNEAQILDLLSFTTHLYQYYLIYDQVFVKRNATEKDVKLTIIVVKFDLDGALTKV